MFWYDGRVQAQARVPFDLTDRGLTLGDGLFETMLVRNRRVFRRKAHLDRLAGGAKVLGMPCDGTEAARALDALAEAIEAGAVRLTLTRGSGPRGLRPPVKAKPVLFGTATPGVPASLFTPVALASTTIRRNDTSPSAKLKSLSYFDAILAGREAWEKGADEALFENTRGLIACSATANIYAVYGNRVVTPPLSDGILAGTTRAYLLEHAARMQVDIVEHSLTREDLLRADAVFVTNSLRLISPCRAIDETHFPVDHPIIRRLQDEIRAAVVIECGHF
jgi:branched-chain amino acid aminotransferase